jgi:hypothetical protein
MPTEDGFSNVTFRERSAAGDKDKKLRGCISILYAYPGAEIGLAAGIYVATDRVNSAIVAFALAAVALFAGAFLIWRKSRILTAIALLPGIFYIAVVAAVGRLSTFPSLCVAVGLIGVAFLAAREKTGDRA